MKLHRNAKTTPTSRLELVRRTVDDGWRYQAVADGYGVSVRTVAKWVQRFRQLGAAGLEDGSSRPQQTPHITSPVRVTFIRQLREQHGLPAWAIGRALRMPRSTVGAWLRRLGLSQRPIAPSVPIQRYEWPHPGDLLHVDIKPLGGVVARILTGPHDAHRQDPHLPDAIRHWSAEGGHPIQDLTAEDGLTPLPSWTPGAKAIADDGLVAEERVLHPALTMVPGRLLPTAPAELLHQRDRPIPRGRPRAVARYVRRPGRWDDDRRTPRPRRFVDGDRVIGGVSGDAHERALDGGEQIEGGGRIIPRRLGQRLDTDHAGLIDTKVELPPATPAAATVFRGGPLTGPDDGQPRAVEHELEALAGRDRSQTAPQMLTAPGERRIVGGGEVEAHHPEQGVQESFGLAQREMVEEPQGQGGLDGEIRVAPLPAPPATPAGRPGSDRFRGHPHRHIAAANEGLIVGRPVRHAILCLIPGMNLRLHPRSVAPAEGPEKCGPRRPTRSGYSCNNANTYDGRIGVRVYLHGKSGGDSALEQLSAEREAIEREVGHALQWNPNPQNRDKVIAIYRDVDLTDRKRWDEHIAWMLDTNRRFLKAFGPRAKKLDLSRRVETPDSEDEQ